MVRHKPPTALLMNHGRSLKSNRGKSPDPSLVIKRLWCGRLRKLGSWEGICLLVNELPESTTQVEKSEDYMGESD